MNYSTVKPFNLAALKVGDFAFKIISAPFISTNIKPHSSNTGDGFLRVKWRNQVKPTVSEHWRKLVPKDQTSVRSGPPHCAHNNAVLFGWRNSSDKGHTIIKGITVVESVVWVHPMYFHMNRGEQISCCLRTK